MGKFINETGNVYSRLTVLSYAGTNKDKKSLWLCQCECGNTKVVVGKHLRSGLTKSCGCLNYENLHIKKIAKKHGKYNERIYRIWQDMKSRCYDPKVPCFKYYGGRGITVCDEWKNSFEEFDKWSMKNGYADNLTIDRKNTYEGYSPDNCRWITIQEQQKNRRSCLKYKTAKFCS